MKKLLILFLSIPTFFTSSLAFSKNNYQVDTLNNHLSISNIKTPKDPKSSNTWEQEIWFQLANITNTLDIYDHDEMINVITSNSETDINNFIATFFQNAQNFNANTDSIFCLHNLLNNISLNSYTGFLVSAVDSSNKTFSIKNIKTSSTLDDSDNIAIDYIIRSIYIGFSEYLEKSIDSVASSQNKDFYVLKNYAQQIVDISMSFNRETTQIGYFKKALDLETTIDSFDPSKDLLSAQFLNNFLFATNKTGLSNNLTKLNFFTKLFNGFAFSMETLNQPYEFIPGQAMLDLSKALNTNLDDSIKSNPVSISTINNFFNRSLSFSSENNKLSFKLLSGGDSRSFIILNSYYGTRNITANSYIYGQPNNVPITNDGPFGYSLLTGGGNANSDNWIQYLINEIKNQAVGSSNSKFLSTEFLNNDPTKPNIDFKINQVINREGKISQNFVDKFLSDYQTFLYNHQIFVSGKTLTSLNSLFGNLYNYVNDFNNHKFLPSSPGIIFLYIIVGIIVFIILIFIILKIRELIKFRKIYKDNK